MVPTPAQAARYWTESVSGGRRRPTEDEAVENAKRAYVIGRITLGQMEAEVEMILTRGLSFIAPV